MSARSTIKGLIRVLGFQVMTKKSWELISKDWTIAQTRSNQLANLERVVELTPADSHGALIKHSQNSSSQLGQDLWVLGNTNQIGTFLEIGAFDGFTLSNSVLLENLGWQGVIVEPIVYDRQSERKCQTKNVAIGVSGVVKFARSKEPEFSTRLDLLDADGLGHIRKESQVINVQSISVSELLKQLNQPSHIDYVSVDTEGNELEILNQWNFLTCTVDFWTIETNGRPDQYQIDELMFSQEYCYIENHSGFDSWYMKHTNASCVAQHRLIKK